MAERPDPFSISLGILIALQSDPTSPLHQELNPSAELQQRLSSFVQQCIYPSSINRSQAWSSTHAMTLSCFVAQLRAWSGDDDLCLLVLDYVNLAATSVDSLLDLMDSLRCAISEGIVDGTSAHGIFLRKVCLGFDEMSFETTSLLWTDIEEQIKLAMQSFQYVNDDRSNNTANPKEVQNSFWPLSASQIEKALRKECFRVNETGYEELDDSSFEEIEVKLRQVLVHDPELPAAHFLRFLNCLKHGERVGALDALHQYFDHAIIQSSRGKSQDILQFASILLSSLHHSFGDHSIACMATDEAVRVAQQSMDAACVAFALGWIFTNEQQGGGATDDGSPKSGDLLQRCASRAVEGHLRPLVAGANLSLARNHLSGTQTASVGGRTSTGLAELAWNSIADASSDRPGVEAADDAVDRPSHMTDIINGRDVMDTLARQKLVSAGVWEHFGQTQLSGMYSFLALYCHSDQMLARDVMTAIENISRMSLYGSPSVLLSRDLDGGVLEELMAVLKGETSASDKTSKCIYADFINKMTSLWKMFHLPKDGVFLLGVTIILHEWAIRRGEIQQATGFGRALESYLHPRLPNYWQVMVDVFSQKSLLLSRQGKWTEAKRLIRDMIEVSKMNDFKTHHASLLLQLALLRLEANPHQFTSSLSPLLECLALTEESEMHGLHATALTILAEVHLRMRNPNRAIALLQASLPSLMQREHVWFQGEAFLTLAKGRLQLARLANPSGEVQGSTQKNSALIRLLRSVLRDLQQSKGFFLRCQDCIRLQEVFYLQARIFNSIPGEQSKRDRAAQSFLDISQHLVRADQPVSCDSVVVSCLSDSASLEAMARRQLPGVASRKLSALKKHTLG